MHREDGLVHVDTSANFLDLGRESFPRRCVGARFQGFCVHLLNKIGPSVANIRDAAVVCSVVDQEANVVVTGLVGIVVIQLVLD